MVELCFILVGGVGWSGFGGSISTSSEIRRKEMTFAFVTRNKCFFTVIT